MSNESTLSEDDEVFILQQNEINAAINRSRQALYKPSDAIECIDCGDDIPPARKIAIPSTERCTECAEVFEKRIKQNHASYKQSMFNTKSTTDD